MNNFILEYYQGITDGTIVVGWEIKAWYTKIIKGMESGEYNYSPKRAKAAIVFNTMIAGLTSLQQGYPKSLKFSYREV